MHLHWSSALGCPQALRGVVVKSTDLSYQRQEVAAAALEFASDRLSHVQTVQVRRVEA